MFHLWCQGNDYISHRCLQSREPCFRSVIKKNLSALMYRPLQLASEAGAFWVALSQIKDGAGFSTLLHSIKPDEDLTQGH